MKALYKKKQQQQQFGRHLTPQQGYPQWKPWNFYGAGGLLLFVKETSSFGIVTEHAPAGARHLSAWGSKSGTKKKESTLQTVMQDFLTSPPQTPVVPCRDRSSSRARGVICSSRPRTPSDNTPKQTTRSLWWCVRVGTLKMLCRPQSWGWRTFRLKPHQLGMPRQSAPTVPPQMTPGLQVCIEYFLFWVTLIGLRRQLIDKMFPLDGSERADERVVKINRIKLQWKPQEDFCAQKARKVKASHSCASWEK